MVTVAGPTKTIEKHLDPKAIKINDVTLSLKVDEASGQVVDTKISVNLSPDDEEIQKAKAVALRDVD